MRQVAAYYTTKIYLRKVIFEKRGWKIPIFRKIHYLFQKGERERERERERETDRQTDRQRDRETHRENNGSKSWRDWKFIISLSNCFFGVSHELKSCELYSSIAKNELRKIVPRK